MDILKKLHLYVIKHANIFFLSLKTVYLCSRYPEYNLFTLKKLIPIEIKMSGSVKTRAFFYLIILT